MKKDINPPKVENIVVAVVKEKDELNHDVWNVYLINQQPRTIENVLVSSKGYFTAENGDKTETSMLRHALGDLESQSYALIEPIMENLFVLHNEYWVSFFVGHTMYDKKYIFLAETIKDENLINIPVVNKKGIMIK
ncbi:MAG: hypothetical protein KDD41_08140 [Flavobacteriales bacterium]|nr:hypothetical protein [Flavobacteriales bacterium]